MTKNIPFKHLGRDLEIVCIPCNELNPYKNNPRTHSKKQIRQIAKSITEFGFTNPILIDENKNLIAGHGRLEAAKLCSIKNVPTIKLKNLSEQQKKAYIIADNKLAENAGWDDGLLNIELRDILEIDSAFDITLTGFEMPEIDALIIQDNEPRDKEEPPVPPINENAISTIGDLWILGDHRLLCGDALQADSYKTLLEEQEAGMIFTDPPYNVPVNGHICGNGSIKHREFPMATGEMSAEEFTDFLKNVLQNLKTFSRDGSIHYICMDWRHISELMSSGNSIYTGFKNLCVWNKNNGGMGSLYRSKHELVFVFKKGSSPHINNIELGKHGRYRTNVWDYAGVNTMKSERMSELAMHPTVKPVAMVEDAILDCSNRGDIILDCFGGSGSTLLAADNSGRRGFLMELDPLYVDVIIKRWQECTGNKALHHETRRTFDDIQSLNASEAAHG